MTRVCLQSFELGYTCAPWLGMDKVIKVIKQCIMIKKSWIEHHANMSSNKGIFGWQLCGKQNGSSILFFYNLIFNILRNYHWKNYSLGYHVMATYRMSLIKLADSNNSVLSKLTNEQYWWWFEYCCRSISYWVVQFFVKHFPLILNKLKKLLERQYRNLWSFILSFPLQLVLLLMLLLKLPSQLKKAMI